MKNRVGDEGIHLGRTARIVFALLAGSLVYSGCSRSHADGHDHAHDHTPAATYKAGHGLQLSEAGQKFLGVKTVEVGLADVGQAKGVAAIPHESLLRTVKGDFVFVVNGPWYLRTPVTVGAADGLMIEIKEGLYEGDKIVSKGKQDLWLAEIQAVNGGVGCVHGH